MNIHLMTEDDGSGRWTIVHPDLGPLYRITLDKQSSGIEFALQLDDLRNEVVLDEDTLMVEA